MEARLTGIDTAEVLAYLGCGNGEGADALRRDIAAAWESLRTIALPKLTYRILELDEPRLEKLLMGKDIRALLQDSRQVVVFGATLGFGVERLMARLQLSDMGQAMVLDACASSAIENVCDNFCADLAERHGYTTDRFSPGYGDLPLGVQGAFFDLLDLSRTIGVTLTDSGLMIPQKSVTAVVGIADSPQPRGLRGCENCGMYATCGLRKENRNCGI